MRVLQVARYGSVRGGVETYVATLSDGLRAAGHEVALAYGIELHPARAERTFHVPGVTEPGTSTPDDALGEAIEAFSPDVIHVHVPEVPWVTPYAAARAPTLLAVHDHRLDCPVGTRYWAGWRRACTIAPGPICLAYNVVAHCGSLRANVTLRPYRSWRRARASSAQARLQVFSSAMADALERAGIERARVGVTAYPVPPPADPIPPEDDDRRPIVLAPGRLTREKGFRELVESMDHVTTSVHLVIAGSGHDRGWLERRARTIGRRHRITFTGWLDPRRLAGWRARASIVVLPSMWPEPFGIVGLEAMAAGLPVVAFDAGGIAEWLQDGVTGTLVAPGDVPALGAALTAMVEDEPMRTRMGEAARARAEAFTIERHLEALMALYGGAA